MMRTEDIVAAYQLILGRPPESETVIEYLGRTHDLDQLGRRLIASDEFRRRASMGGIPAGVQRWVCSEVRGGLRLWVDLMDLGVGAGVLRDDWEPDETRFVMSQLAPGDCFVDIGANIGWFSVLAASRVGPTGGVHAFEPRPDLFRRLTQSVVENGMQGWCHLHNVALGATETEMVLAAVPSEFNEGHSFLVNGAVTDGAVEVARVPVRPLDKFDLGRRVDLIKIDVEGAEAMALSGATALLARDKPIIVSEYFPVWLRKVSGIEPRAYLDMLRGLDYSIYALTPQGLGSEIDDLPEGVERDDFFVNIVAVPEGRSLRPVVDVAFESVAAVSPAHEITRALFDARLRELSVEVSRVSAVRLDALKAQVGNSHEMALRHFDQRIGVLAAELRDMHGAGLLKIDQGMIRAQEKVAEIERVVNRSNEQIEILAGRIADIGGAVLRLETLSKPKFSIGAKLLREVRRPFSRQFWERRKEKWALLRRNMEIAGRVDPLQPNWGSIQSDRAQAPCLLGVEKPLAMIIDDRFPEPDRDSGSVDAVNMIESLVAFGYHVVFGVQTARKQLPCYLQMVRNVGGCPMTEADAPSIQAFVERFGRHVDLFVLNRVGTGGQFLELIRYNSPEAKIVFNTVDLHYIREARAARLSGDVIALAQAERTRDREEFLVGKSDLTLVVSSVEQEVLAASVPGAATLVLPLARRIRAPQVSFSQRSGIGFVGGFEHAPNIDAIRHFLADIWPIIYARDPSMRFDIVGSHLPDDVLQGVVGNVRYLGPIDSLDDWLDSLRMSIAPLRIGAGAKGKVASSLCSGLPCILSKVAAEGMDLQDEVNVLVGNSTIDFAEKIIKLHNDPELWARLSSGALDFAKSRLSTENYAQTLRQGVIGIGLPAFAA